MTSITSIRCQWKLIKQLYPFNGNKEWFFCPIWLHLLLQDYLVNIHNNDMCITTFSLRICKRIGYERLDQ